MPDPYEPDRALADLDCLALRERVRKMQTGIDRALSALHSSAYVGGPTEREAWQTVERELGPFETQHQGAALADHREGEDGD